ncbi:hypothetical protein Tco_1432951, partial [Tanacetum coccineum]
GIASVLKGAPWRRKGVRRSLAVTIWTLALALGVAGIASVLKGAPWRRQGVRRSLAVTIWTLALTLGVA